MEYQGKPRIKTSEDKLTYPGKKKLYRSYDNAGIFIKDILTLEEEPKPQNSEPLLKHVFKKGKLTINMPNLKEIQQYYLQNIKKLPDKFKSLYDDVNYNVELSDNLQQLTNVLQNKKELGY